MELILDRKYKKTTYCIGRLYVDGKFICNTIEDRDRHLTQDMPLEQIKKIKVAALTAIPTGTYKIRMDVISPKYSLKPWYLTNCHGARVPRLVDVKGWDGVLIHTGNTEKDSSGCIIVGINDVPGMVTKSKDTFLKLYNMMYAAYRKGEPIKIIIR